MPDRHRYVSSPATLVPTDRPQPSGEQRLAALWQAHYGHVLAYTKRRAPADVAAEVAAATFTVLWRRIDEPLDDPLPWLYAVARRQLANHRRGDARRLRLVGRQRRSALLSVPDVADAAVAGAEARAALAKLSPDDREVLMLVAWEGLDSAGGAAVLGISTATFAVRLHRARQRLESILSPSPEEPTP